MVHMTRSIAPGTGVVQDAPAGLAPTDRIIADFRATMRQLKCAMSERSLQLGISMAQLNILYSLHRSGEMPMSRLADVLNVSLSSATGLIDRLEERGYIERTRVPEDRRIVMVRLTQAGVQMIEEQDALADDLLRSVLGRLKPSQLPAIAQATADLRAALEATTGRPPDRHLTYTPAPRSASTLRGAEARPGAIEPSDHPATTSRRD
jgi:DNA-binding MarR family transcriptional regulator